MACYVVHMLRSEPTPERRHGPEKGSKRRGFGRLRQERSGRWAAGYTGPDGRLYRAPATFEDEDAARGWLNNERKLIDLDDWMPPEQRVQRRKRATTTLDDFSATWLAVRTVKGRPLKPRTREHYRQLLDRQILPTFGRLPVASITSDAIDDWYADLGPDRPTLRSHAYGLLRTILGAAVDKNLILVNPCRVRGGSSTSRAHKVEPLTLVELERLVTEMPAERRLMVLLAAWCALRFGELAELRRRDVDVRNQLVKVRRGVVRADGQRIVGDPKSEAGSRNVAIPPHLMPVVKEHLKAHTEPGRDALLFPSASGGHLAPSTLYGRNPIKIKTGKKTVEWRGGHGFYRARAVAGRPTLHFHDLRHTGAVLAAQTGATLAELMSRLGHSTPAAAMRYQHAAAGRDQAIAAKLSELVGGAS